LIDALSQGSNLQLVNVKLNGENYLEWVHSVKFTLDEKENKNIQPKTLYNKEKMILHWKNGNIKIPLLCGLSMQWNHQLGSLADSQ